MLWLTVVLTSLSIHYEPETRTLVETAVQDYLQLKPPSVSTYYVYSKKGSELFYHEELYIEVTVPLLLSNATYARAIKEKEQMEKAIGKVLNREAVVKITDVGFKVDRRVLNVVVVVVPVTLVLLVCCFSVLFAQRKRKENLENMWLLA